MKLAIALLSLITLPCFGLYLFYPNHDSGIQDYDHYYIIRRSHIPNTTSGNDKNESPSTKRRRVYEAIKKSKTKLPEKE